MNDDEWRNKVDEQLLRDLIEDLQDRVKDLDITLRGERGKSGLIAEYARHDEMLTRLYAVVIQDSTGKKGLLHDIDHLMGRKSDREKNRQYRWQFWTAILVAMISAGTAMVTNWDKIKKNLPKYHPGPLEAKIDRARRPKSPKKLYRVRVVPAPLDSGDPGPTTLPPPE